MGHSINEVNIKRHEPVKPDLNDQFKQLCGSNTPVTKLLFGDDLPKLVKEIHVSDTNKVGVKVSSKPPTHYNKQQKRSNFSHRPYHQSQMPFLCNMSTTSARVLSGVPNTEKQMKARGRFGRVLLLF